jgi:hypothetical protein
MPRAHRPDGDPALTAAREPALPSAGTGEDSAAEHGLQPAGGGAPDGGAANGMDYEQSVYEVGPGVGAPADTAAQRRRVELLVGLNTFLVPTAITIVVPALRAIAVDLDCSAELATRTLSLDTIISGVPHPPTPSDPAEGAPPR